VEAVLKIVEECWSQPLRVGDLAELVGLSPVRLQHLFKQETGTSVRRSLLDRRLSEAKHLLISSNASVKEICFRVGFGDQANFQASFKKRFGRHHVHFGWHRGVQLAGYLLTASPRLLGINSPLFY